MVNPYAQQRPKPQPKSTINIGQSQALKKVEAIQNKQFKKGGSNKNQSDSDDDDSLLRRSSKKFLKSSNEYKKEQQKQPIIRAISDDDEDVDEVEEEDDDDDDDDDYDEDITLNASSQTLKIDVIQTAPSTSRQIGSASSLSKRNKVQFETDLNKIKRPTSGSMKGDTDDNLTESENVFNKNVIFDIGDLDVEDEAPKRSSKKSDRFLKKDKKTQPSPPPIVKMPKPRNLSKSTISENIEFSSLTNDDDDIIREQVVFVKSENENSDDEETINDTDSIVQKNIIFDINDLGAASDDNNNNNNNAKPYKSSLKPKIEPRKQTDNTKKPKQKTTTINREPSIIFTEEDPDEQYSSIATEIRDDYNDRGRATPQQNYDYNDDFISETEPQSTSRRTKSSLKSPKRVSISPQPFVKQRSAAVHATNSTTKQSKTIETQVNETDFINKYELINSLNWYTPSSYVNTKKTYLNNLNRMIEFNTVNHAVNEMIRMNVQFLKNFLTTQRIMYETELESIKPEVVDQ